MQNLEPAWLPRRRPLGLLTSAALVTGTVLLAGCSTSAPDQVNEVFTSLGAQVQEPAGQLYRFDGLAVYEASATLPGSPQDIAGQINGDLAAIGISVECDGQPAELPFEMEGQNSPPDMECVMAHDRGRYYLTQSGDSTTVTAFYN